LPERGERGQRERPRASPTAPNWAPCREVRVTCPTNGKRCSTASAGEAESPRRVGVDKRRSSTPCSTETVAGVLPATPASGINCIPHARALVDAASAPPRARCCEPLRPGRRPHARRRPSAPSPTTRRRRRPRDNDRRRSPLHETPHGERAARGILKQRETRGEQRGSTAGSGNVWRDYKGEGRRGGGGRRVRAFSSSFAQRRRDPRATASDATIDDIESVADEAAQLSR